MSLKRLRTKTYLLLALMVLFGSLGNVLLSRGMKETGEILDFSPRALEDAFVKVFMNGSIWFGISSLLIFFVSYLLLLSWADYSYVQPASAIGYAFVAVLGYFQIPGAGVPDGLAMDWHRFDGHRFFLIAGLAFMGRRQFRRSGNSTELRIRRVGGEVSSERTCGARALGGCAVGLPRCSSNLDELIPCGCSCMRSSSLRHGSESPIASWRFGRPLNFTFATAKGLPAILRRRFPF